MDTVYVHADESCLGNQFRRRANPGGAGGLVEVWRDGAWERRDYWISEPDTTNNRMAIRSAIEVLRRLKRRCTVHLVSDSQYLVKGIGDWMPGWKARGWTRKGGRIENVELWQLLDAELQRHDVRAAVGARPRRSPRERVRGQARDDRREGSELVGRLPSLGLPGMAGRAAGERTVPGLHGVRAAGATIPGRVTGRATQKAKRPDRSYPRPGRFFSRDPGDTHDARPASLLRWRDPGPAWVHPRVGGQTLSLPPFAARSAAGGAPSSSCYWVRAFRRGPATSPVGLPKISQVLVRLSPLRRRARQLTLQIQRGMTNAIDLDEPHLNREGMIHGAIGPLQDLRCMRGGDLNMTP